MNKHIRRDPANAKKIFNNRGLATDYRTLSPLLRPGMKVLDIGCGTGAISKDIAEKVGPEGHVTGIDNTEKFIAMGMEGFGHIPNLTLVHTDLFEFNPDEKYDLIVAARVLQWLSNPLEALVKMKSMLKTGGQASILDYNHNDLEWNPKPPESMQQFYRAFLKWREGAGMHNGIADELPNMFREAGFMEIEKFKADEHYERGQDNFVEKAGIWSKVAASTQMVEEGYLDDVLRLRAIEEYSEWVVNEAFSMTMKLKEVRGKIAKYNPMSFS